MATDYSTAILKMGPSRRLLCSSSNSQRMRDCSPWRVWQKLEGSLAVAGLAGRGRSGVDCRWQHFADHAIGLHFHLKSWQRITRVATTASPPMHDPLGTYRFTSDKIWLAMSTPDKRNPYLVSSAGETLLYLKTWVFLPPPSLNDTVAMSQSGALWRAFALAWVKDK